MDALADDTADRTQDPSLRVDTPPPHVPATDDAVLVSLSALAHEMDSLDIAAELDQLAARVGEGRFYVACVGQFKRGKSTLLNALVGQELLPTGVVPVTAIVTVLRHGAELSARVRVGTEWRTIDPADLVTYVTEEQNPGNTKDVTGAEVFVPAPSLADGLSLVDTPGVGSVFAGGTQATQEFVPHIDAAIIVLGADPPISAEELTLAEDVAAGVDDILVILNKADRVPATDRAQAVTFTRRVLTERLERPVDDIFEISATGQLPGEHPYGDWDALVAALDRLTSRSGSDLVSRAETRGAHRLGARLRRELDERLAALDRPIEESEQRIRALREEVAVGERSLDDLSYILLGERKRLSEAFLARRAAFIERTLPAAREELRAAIDEATARSGPALRGEAGQLTVDVARSWLKRWRDEEQPIAESMYGEAADRFTDAASQFLRRLSASGATAFTELPDRIEVNRRFRTSSRLYFQFDDPMSLLGGEFAVWLLDRIRPLSAVRRGLQRTAAERLEQLLKLNTTRLVNDLDEQVLESCRRLETEIRAHLSALTKAAERALTIAQQRLAEGADAVAAERAQLNHMRKRIDAAIGTVPGD